MKLATGTIFYNDVYGLKRLLPTIQEFDYNFFVDGSWPDWEKTELSNDGSREIILSFKNSILTDHPEMPSKKYDRVLRLCEQFGVDYLIMIDSDTYIQQPFNYERFKNELENIPKIYKAQCIRWRMDYFDLSWHNHLCSNGLFYNPGLCHYGERHNEVFCDGRELIHSWSGDVKEITLIHDKRYRLKEYIEKRRLWNEAHPTH